MTTVPLLIRNGKDTECLKQWPSCLERLPEAERRGARGQREREGGALGPGPLGDEVPAHAPGEPAPDREPEPEAGLAVARGAALEAGEDALVLARPEAGAAIGHLDGRRLAIRADVDDGLAPARAVAQRVLEQQPHDPGHGRGVRERPGAA